MPKSKVILWGVGVVVVVGASALIGYYFDWFGATVLSAAALTAIAGYNADKEQKSLIDEHQKKEDAFVDSVMKKSAEFKKERKAEEHKSEGKSLEEQKSGLMEGIDDV